jgi:hypothetical protein
MAATLHAAEPEATWTVALRPSETPVVHGTRLPVRFTDAELQELGSVARKHRSTPEAFLRALWHRWRLDRECEGRALAYEVLQEPACDVH